MSLGGKGGMRGDAEYERIAEAHFMNQTTLAELTSPPTSVPPRTRHMSHKPLLRQAAQWPDPLESEAYHGLAGDIVQTIAPHTEADPAALLVQLLVAFGNVVDRGPHFWVEAADRHAANLFAVIVGETSKARKGISLSHIRRLFRAADETWAESLITNGLSSGEGLIWQVRDPIEEWDSKKQAMVTKDPGVADKRLLVIEPEFGRVLQVAERQGNTLSATIRQAWDGDALRVMTRTTSACSMDSHISIVGHITVDELGRLLTDTQAANGFANRFLWICAHRSKELPEGGNLREQDLDPLRVRLTESVELARQIGAVQRDDSARQVWREVYGGLSTGQPGLFGAVTSRAEAQTMRLALIYALLDRSNLMRSDHLLAALAIWKYAEASARYIFGDVLGDPAADRILMVLRNHPDGMTRHEIVRAFSGHRSKADIDRALHTLVRLGRAYRKMVETGGRPAEQWSATAT